MIAFMLWAAVVLGFILGFLFGDAEVRGTLLMVAMFVALGAAVHVLERIKHGNRNTRGR